jgi:hypothetical protein
MPLHDWTRVDAGIFHSFHLSWIAEIGKVLNNGLLPEGYYSLGEQVAGRTAPDVLALHEQPPDAVTAFVDPDEDAGGGTALLVAPPQTRIVAEALEERYSEMTRRIVIRHVSGDRLVAMIEVVSAGNKASERNWEKVIAKSMAAIERGIHLLVLDLYPPTARDPGGFHGSLWGQFTGTDFELPADADRTLAAYSAGPVKTAYVEPVAVGRPLRAMPLFLTRDGVGYVEVPLEATYTAAYAATPQRYRRMLEGVG